jgi:hypothetical protein
MAKGQFPKTASGSRLKNAWKLYNAGDVVAARREANAVLADSPNASTTPSAHPTDAELAKELIDRTGVPRIAWYLALMAAALVSIMIAVGIAHH